MDDRRRKHDEISPQSHPGGGMRAPLKKRLAMSSSVPNTIPSTPAILPIEKTNGQLSPSQTFSQGEALEDVQTSYKEYLKGLSKQSLLSEMRSFKEESQRLESLSFNLREKAYRCEAQLGAINVLWQQLEDDTPALRSRTNSDSDWPEQSVMDLGHDASDILHRLSRLPLHKSLTALDYAETQKALKKRAYDVIEVSQQTFLPIEDWNKRLKSSYADDSSQSNIFQSEASDIDKWTQNHSRVIPKIRLKEKEISAKLASVRKELLTVQKKYRSALEDMEEVKQRLLAKEKKLDRLKIAARSSMTGEGDTRTIEQTPVEEEVATPTKPANIAQEQAAVEEQQSLEAQELEYRKNELASMQADQQRLAAEVAYYKSQLANIPDERIADSIAYRHGQQACIFYKTRVDECHERTLALESEIAEIRKSFTEFSDQLQVEKKSQLATFESEIKKLQTDLNRIRGQRDYFTQLLQQATSKYEKENTERTVLAKNMYEQKDRMAKLVSELTRLQSLEPNATTDDVFGSEFVRLDEKIQALKQMQDECDKCQAELELLSSSNLSVENLKKREDLIKSIEKNIEKNKQQEMAELIADLKCFKLRLRLESESLNGILKEIEDCGKAYSRLQDQVTRKAFSISSKDDHISKLRLEKAKYAQTFSGLHKAEQQQASLAKTLKARGETQAEHIKQLLSKRSALEGQINAAEQNCLKQNQQIEEKRSALRELSHTNMLLHQRVSSNDHRTEELQRLVTQQMRAFEEVSQALQKSKEALEALQKRYDHLSQMDNPSDSELAQEAKELKVCFIIYIQCADPLNP
ncbi:hypothetical protein BZG36_02639 [Bifiguratus adelaidae]|uniref:E3 ubiquitin protein ligase n=1 Tax=Bifiguratus adelaidae TaxID=1938954 RepID=A0A261Y2S4_9FUNG|nr:hypothetical protein BZG36_02639 [Bifiguratus adelaidae]